jgi:hypothetical protein
MNGLFFMTSYYEMPVWLSVKITIHCKMAGFYFDVLDSMYLKHCPDSNTMSTFNQLIKPMDTL